MTAYTNLVGSDTLFFRSLEYDRTGPSFGAFTPGHKSFSNICIRKLPGQLSFKLNTVKHLNIQQPFDFDVEFVAPPHTSVVSRAASGGRSTSSLTGSLMWARA